MFEVDELNPPTEVILGSCILGDYVSCLRELVLHKETGENVCVCVCVCVWRERGRPRES